MPRTCCLIAISLLPLTPAIASALIVDVPLQLTPPTSANNQFTIDVSAEVFLAGTIQDSAAANLTGTAAARLELELLPAGAIVTGIRFEGGDIDASDVSLSLSIFNASSSGLGGSLDTPGSAFSPVAADGSFATTDHQVTIDQGSIVFPGGSEDFNTSPLTVPGVPGESASINAQVVGGTGQTLDYGVTVTLPVAVVDSLPIDNVLLINNAIDFGVAGSLVMVGQFSIDLPTQGDFNEDGVVDGADYARWRNLFGAGQAPASDLDLWRQNFGQAATTGSIQAATSAPEPGAAGLLAIFGALLTPAAGRKRTTAF